MTAKQAQLCKKHKDIIAAMDKKELLAFDRSLYVSKAELGDEVFKYLRQQNDNRMSVLVERVKIQDALMIEHGELLGSELS